MIVAIIRSDEERKEYQRLRAIELQLQKVATGLLPMTNSVDRIAPLNFVNEFYVPDEAFEQ